MASFDAAIRPIAGTFTRVVESQTQIATTSLVGGDLARQDVLEQLLEASKPARVPGTEHLHYLLATPWRYPPLQHGSRFGTVTEPSLFYASLDIRTALAEVAHYRWLFFSDMETPPAGGLSSQHTSFKSNYASSRGLQLQLAPFDAQKAELTDPHSHTATQALGSDMRAARIEAFEFLSARSDASGINVALLAPCAHASETVHSVLQWQCETQSNRVVFSGWNHERVLMGFERPRVSDNY